MPFFVLTTIPQSPETFIYAGRLWRDLWARPVLWLCSCLTFTTLHDILTGAHKITPQLNCMHCVWIWSFFLNARQNQMLGWPSVRRLTQSECVMVLRCLAQGHSVPIHLIYICGLGIPYTGFFFKMLLRVKLFLSVVWADSKVKISEQSQECFFFANVLWGWLTYRQTTIVI